eukprot:TRINITY_DN1109_c0_g1_i1.p1 TRINITY_DN1109_c0_g1~~TRINITY_DN1109_c0_g1_i1.p1  ORF type:complete len:375 (-),score=84.38 TRINITY_DN1109_c0_g1_i1:453-1577(-)
MDFSQVNVQAPPGLENVSSRGFEGDLSAHQQHQRDPRWAFAAEKELKDTLIREVTRTVRKLMESKVEDAVDKLWQRGNQAMQSLQEQQLQETMRLQSQLEACTEAHKQLERENYLLHAGLEALMKHLTHAFGPPPHGPPPPVPPPPVPRSYSQPRPVPPAWERRTVRPHAERGATAESSSPAKPSSEEDLPKQASRGDTEMAREVVADSNDAFEPEAGVVAGAEAGSEPADGVGFTANLIASSQEAHEEVATFSFTLRRADDNPLGLDVRSEDSCLLVIDVRAGGAVEAWNRVCAGESREIRANDRIIMINGQTDPDLMREQCLTKHLLRMTVQRGEPGFAAQGDEANRSSGSMRVEADEFVPGQPKLERPGVA